MGSNQVFVAIEQIAKAKGTNAKQLLLANYARSPEFFRVVQYALNPFRTFGVTSLPSEPRAFSRYEFDHGTWLTLDQLAQRDLTGNAAKEALRQEVNSLHPASIELLRRIITKDLRAGFGATLANKVVPGWVPTFDCMLAHPFEVKRVKSWPVGVEPKLDGFRALALIDLAAGTARMLSRSGQEYSSFEHLKPRLLELCGLLRSEYNEDQLVFDGEVVSGTFNNTASQVRKKNVACTDAVYHVFDVLPGSVFDKGRCDREYEYRRQSVGVLPAVGTVRRTPLDRAYSEADIHWFYEQYRADGLEGVIVKALNGKYELKRSHSWMKIKAEETLDLPIIGAFEGMGKYQRMLGGLTVLHKDVEVNVGSGFSDQQRAEFWDVYLHGRGNGKAHALLGRIAEVQYHEVTPDGSLRHPRFVRFREDKEAA